MHCRACTATAWTIAATPLPLANGIRGLPLHCFWRTARAFYAPVRVVYTHIHRAAALAAAPRHAATRAGFAADAGTNRCHRVWCYFTRVPAFVSSQRALHWRTAAVRAAFTAVPLCLSYHCAGVYLHLFTPLLLVTALLLLLDGDCVYYNRITATPACRVAAWWFFATRLYARACSG